eukprot:gb/GECG01005435.1/.p1 GENE.gb/GECG01005435.1/~~gb/GECG01005435.1/.p1  ORF type:complete len:973 (+),score=119.69 gb/GECG01005435.1/:1-2919(+)
MPILRSLFGQKGSSDSSYSSSSATQGSSSHSLPPTTSTGYISDGNKASGDNFAASSSSLPPNREAPTERINSHSAQHDDYDALYHVPESSTTSTAATERNVGARNALMNPGEWAKSLGKWFSRASDALPSRQRVAQSARQTWEATQTAWNELSQEQKIRMIALAFASAAVVVLVARGGPRLLSQKKKGLYKRHRKTKYKKTAENDADKSDACERGHEIIREAKSPARETNGGSGPSRTRGSALYNVFFNRDRQSMDQASGDSLHNVEDSESAVSVKTEEPNGSQNGVHETDTPPRPLENPPIVQRKHHHRHNHMDHPVGTKIERDSDFLASKVASAYTGAFVLPFHLRRGTKPSTESETSDRQNRTKATVNPDATPKSHKRHTTTASAGPSEVRSVEAEKAVPNYRIDTSKVVARPEPTTHASLANSVVKNPRGWLDVPEYNPKQYLTPSNMPVSFGSMSQTSKVSDGYRSLDDARGGNPAIRPGEPSDSASVLERASVSPLAEKSHRRMLTQENRPFAPKATSHSADSYSHRYRSTTAQYSRTYETYAFTGSISSRIGNGPAVVHAPSAYGTAYTKDPHRSYVERSAGFYQTSRYENGWKSNRWSAPRHNSGALSRSQLEDNPPRVGTGEKALSTSAIHRTPVANRRTHVFTDDEVDQNQHRFMGSLSPGRAPATRRNSHDVRRSLMEDDFETEPGSDSRSEIGQHDGVVLPRHGKGKRGVAGNRIRGGVDTGVSFGLGPGRRQQQQNVSEPNRKRQQQTTRAVRRITEVPPGVDESESLANSQRQSPSPKPPALPPRHGPEAEEAARVRRERADAQITERYVNDNDNAVENTGHEGPYSGNGDHLSNGVNYTSERTDQNGEAPPMREANVDDYSSKGNTFITDRENNFSDFSFANGTAESAQYLKRGTTGHFKQEDGSVESAASQSPSPFHNSNNSNGPENGNVSRGSPDSPTDLDHITRTLGHRLRKSE